ncbi:hypothetical protein HW555_013023 [Spodoptera exigua]|uniref:Uncharacterized protein n=1 Tax=Spodoptera exigua TaxID=7107 RepID=A0A835G4U0_SPOEX|nr:hypothetical protein HW555_013023 [Spodoptera exigua]
MLGFVMRTSSEFNNLGVATVLYNAYIRSKLEYGGIVWAPSEEKYNIMLERVQRKFARWLYKKRYGYYPYLYPSSFVAGMVDLETLKFRRVVQTILHYLSIVHHKVDNPIVLGMVRLLVPKRLAWNEQGQLRRGVGLAFCGGLKRAPTMRCMHRLFGHWALLRI